MIGGRKIFQFEKELEDNNVIAEQESYSWLIRGVYGNNSFVNGSFDGAIGGAITGGIVHALGPATTLARSIGQGVLTGESTVNTVFAIKFPAGTTIYTGPVATQGGAYLGGENVMQIYIPNPWDIEGIEVLGQLPLSGGIE